MSASEAPGSRAGAREEILARISTALADRAPVDAIPRDYRVAGATQVSDLIGTFEERLIDYKARVHRCAISELPALVAELTAARERVIAAPGLPPAWLADCGALLADEPELSIGELDSAGGVITGCAVAIALTGTIVLDHDAGQGRRALTLVPDYHLAIVRADQIVPGVPDAIDVLDPLRPLTWISGPSATSDIELNRVEGVHGPRTLEVIIAE